MQSENSESEFSTVQFKINDLVWAKVTGYPWWPANITQINSTSEKPFRVDFLSDNTHAFLSSQKIVPYEDGRDEYMNCKKINNNFRNAMELAEEKYHTIVKQTSPTCALLRSSSQDSQQQNQQGGSIEDGEDLEDELKDNMDCPKSLSNSHKESYSYKKQKILEKERLMQWLLEKYNLKTIPAMSTKRRPSHFRKTKKILKQPKVCETVHLARRIYRLLRQKSIPKETCQTVATCLAKQTMMQKGNRFQYLISLLRWITMSESDVVEKYYQQWQQYTKPDHLKEKPSDMTNFQ